MAKQFKTFTSFNGIDNLSRTTKQIARNFGATTRAAMATNRAVQAVSKSAKRMGQSLRSASLAGVIGLTATLAPAIAFSDQINELEAVSQATTQQMSDLTSQAKELGSTTRFSASEAAAAQTFLARAGFETNQILAATPDVLNLAAASNMELARTADIASNIMGAFKIEANEMGRVADVLAATTASANVDLEQLSESLKFAAPVAQKAGLSLEETAAAVGLLGNIGIQGTLSGTALRLMLSSLAAPSAKATKLLSQLGIKTKTADGQLRKLPNILADISKGLTTLPEANRIAAINELFGLRGISAGAELIDQAGVGSLDRLAEKLLDVEGRAQSMAETMNKGPGGAVRKLKSAAEGLALAIGDSGLTGQFTEIITKLTEFTSQLSGAEVETLATITTMLLLLAVASPILISLGTLASGIGLLASGMIFLGGVIGGTLVPVISGALLPVLTKLRTAFLILSLVNPLAPVIIGVALLITALAALAIFWDDIVAAVSIGIEKLINLFSPLTNLLSNAASIGGLFADVVLGLGNEEEGGNNEEGGETQSLPAQLAGNRASAQAAASARIAFENAPDNVVITDNNGGDIDPDLGITATAGA